MVKEGLPGKSGDASTWEEVCFIGNASKKADTIDPTLYFFSEENDKWKLSVSHVGVAVCVVVVFAGLKFLVARVTHFGNSLPWAKAAAT